jgi:signal transduction histidine kinase
VSSALDPSHSRIAYIFLEVSCWGPEYNTADDESFVSGTVWLTVVKFSTLVQFSKLVADSLSSENVSSLLSETVVHRCGVFHALVFGTDAAGEFKVLSSYGGCKSELSNLDMTGVDTVTELRTAVMNVCGNGGYNFRAFPLISDAGLFGALGVLYMEGDAPNEQVWTFIEALTELTAISLNKAYQHAQLQKAFDDLRASQDTLVRTEKFRALGQMAAGIAHDLRNLLNPLQLYADHIKDSANNPAEVLDGVQRIDRVLGRGLETVERLRDFSRFTPEDSEAVPTDLDVMVHEALEICKPRLATNELALESGNPPPVKLRPADCVTAIVNLIFNAVDATEGRGKITVRTGVSDGGSWIEIQDNGPGIPAEVRARILEPLFTTKGKQGTGLGISIVYAFTQKHGGRLDIDSEPGRGARFRMWFPSQDSPLR